MKDAELNVAAFAAQVLGRLTEWPEFDPAIRDSQGGAIALGHPLGTSGTGTPCIGVGQGLALVLER